MLRRGLAFAGIALLAACSTTRVEVNTTVPVPVVRPMPLTLGVHYSEEFAGYHHSEEIPDRGTWEVDMGASQMSMFETVLGAMFDRVVHLAAAPTPAQPATGVHAVLLPSVDDFQIALPIQNRNNFNEVWIRYSLALTEPDGSPIATWPVIAYGKARAGSLEFEPDAMEKAARVALRDGAAFFTIGFAGVPEVRDWLNRHGIGTGVEVREVSDATSPPDDGRPAPDTRAPNDAPGNGWTGQRPSLAASLQSPTAPSEESP